MPPYRTRIAGAPNRCRIGSVGVVLSTAIVTPVFAQQAVSEPGMQAFYQSLGVGSQSSAPSAMASTRSVSYASTPAKHISAKHKM
jgi:hypothetical protein